MQYGRSQNVCTKVATLGVLENSRGWTPPDITPQDIRGGHLGNYPGHSIIVELFFFKVMVSLLVDSCKRNMIQSLIFITWWTEMLLMRWGAFWILAHSPNSPSVNMESTIHHCNIGRKFLNVWLNKAFYKIECSAKCALCLSRWNLIWWFTDTLLGVKVSQS